MRLSDQALPMSANLPEILCTQCGLCCDGSLFGDVELSGEKEAAELEVMGLSVELDDQHLLLQPCTALEGKRCSIYRHRPGCCRTFECRILKNAEGGVTTVDQAKEIIAQTLELTKRMKAVCVKAGVPEEFTLKERCQEVLSGENVTDDFRDEFSRAMKKLDQLVQQEFLS